MRKAGISQEMLKIIACITMLLDHVGATLWPALELRIIGRLAFPIYCFLLAEGLHFTKDPKRYGLRLLMGALLSEIPFDLLFYGRVMPYYHSVMVTLLLGFLYAMVIRITQNLWMKIALAVPFMIAADKLGTDYGDWGVAMIALFILTRQMPNRKAWQFWGLMAICWLIGGMTIRLGPVRVPIELFGVLALVPIGLYSGEKSTRSNWVQRLFYLFYPVHLAVLWLIQEFL